METTKTALFISQRRFQFRFSQIRVTRKTFLGHWEETADIVEQNLIGWQQTLSEQGFKQKIQIKRSILTATCLPNVISRDKLPTNFIVTATMHHDDTQSLFTNTICENYFPKQCYCVYGGGGGGDWRNVFFMFSFANHLSLQHKVKWKVLMCNRVSWQKIMLLQRIFMNSWCNPIQTPYLFSESTIFRKYCFQKNYRLFCRPLSHFLTCSVLHCFMH